MLNLQIIVIIIKSVLIKNHDHCYYEAYKMYKMLYYERIDVSERINVNKTVHQKNALFATIRTFYIKGLRFDQLSEVVVMM